jgi:hypothetical protein
MTNNQGDALQDASNLMKFWPLLVACVAVISAATAGQLQLNGHEEELSRLKQEVTETHELQIRMEERQKVIQEDLEEVSQGVKEIQRFIRNRDQ